MPTQREQHDSSAASGPDGMPMRQLNFRVESEAYEYGMRLARQAGMSLPQWARQVYLAAVTAGRAELRAAYRHEAEAARRAEDEMEKKLAEFEAQLRHVPTAPSKTGRASRR